MHAPENLRLDLAQIHLDAKFVAPHLLEFDGDVLMDFSPAAAGGIKRIFKARKSFATRITGLGEQFARLFRVITEAFRRMIILRPRRHQMGRGHFAGPRDFFYDALLVHRKCQRLADARVVKWFARDIETEKISAEIIERMKIGTLEQHIHQFRRNKFLVPDNVRLAVFVKIQRRIRRADRQQVNDFRLGVGRRPSRADFF